MNRILVFLLVVVSFLLFSCNIKDEKRVNKYNINTLNNQKKQLLNRNITSFNNIFGDSINTANKVIMLYNEFDCGSCINEAFNKIKTLDSINSSQSCYVITSSVNISKDQLINDYSNYVFYDEHDKIRRELKYIKTPVLLKLSSCSKVKDVYFPGADNGSFNIDKYINIGAKDR
jgi:hypothetical protein